MPCPEAAVAGGVHEACSVPVRRAASPVVGEVVGGDCSPGVEARGLGCAGPQAPTRKSAAKAS